MKLHKNINKTLKWILIGIAGTILLYFPASFIAVFMLTYFSLSKRIENKGEEKYLKKSKETIILKSWNDIQNTKEKSKIKIPLLILYISTLKIFAISKLIL